MPMPLPPISREANLKDSIKQFFIENCDPYGIPVQFDRTLAQPNLGGTEVNKWLSLIVGDFYYLSSRHVADLLCNICTRQDPEGYTNVRVADFVRGLLQDDSYTDGLARIPIYDFKLPHRPEIGTVLPTGISGGKEIILEDQTQVKQLTIRLWHAV